MMGGQRQAGQTKSRMGMRILAILEVLGDHREEKITIETIKDSKDQPFIIQDSIETVETEEGSVVSRNGSKKVRMVAEEDTRTASHRAPPCTTLEITPKDKKKNRITTVNQTAS